MQPKKIESQTHLSPDLHIISLLLWLFCTGTTVILRQLEFCQASQSQTRTWETNVGWALKELWLNGEMFAEWWLGWHCSLVNLLTFPYDFAS